MTITTDPDDTLRAAERVAWDWLERMQHHVVGVVLHERPADFPNDYVLRAGEVIPGELEPVTLADAIVFRRAEDARAFVEHYFPHLSQLAPHPSDQPTIILTWI